MSEELANKIYLIRNTGSGKYLNVWGIDQVGNNRNVNQYDLSAELSQLFWVQITASGVVKLTSVIKDSGNLYYSLNINGNTNNANLYVETITNDLDSALDFIRVEGNNYRIALKNPRADGSTLYLTALGDSNGTSSTVQTEGNVVWAANDGSNYQIWNFEYMADYSEGYDLRKLDAQIFLHKFYGSDITIDARASSALCRELTKALQQIVLNIDESDPGYGSFGPATLAACPTLFVGMAATDKVKRIVTLFCHALFCKGYSPTSISDVYNEKVAAGVKDFQQDAGLAETGIVSPAQMKAIFNTDSYVLSSKGDTRVREIQQAMNGQYNDYTGINPCDGIYSRATNNALIYAIQKEIGISVEDSAPSFGPTTFSKFPTLPFTGDSKEQGCNETMLTKILQYALYVNGYYSGAFDGSFSGSLVNAIKEFQNFMAYPAPITEYADARVMKGLLASCGDQSRSCIACDTATVLNAATAAALYNAGYRYVGRYLTGTVLRDGFRVSKALSKAEADAILEAGLAIIPIYQDGGERSAHFSRSRGKADAEKAYVAAKALGIPDESIIYFAVDFDAMGSDLDSILAYFDAVTRTMKDYYVGIYGTRNICTTVMQAGGAYKCYVSDMSTGYSGNLGYRMPDFWAFDQFATTTVAGVEIDKVAYSGEDPAVKLLQEPDVTGSEYTDMALNAAVHSKICDFQEDMPILLMQLKDENSSDDEPVFTDLIGSLPNMAYTKSWKRTLINIYNLKVEYALAVGASVEHEGEVMTVSVSNGTISVTDSQKINDAITAAQAGSQSFPVTPGQVTGLMSGLATSIKSGSVTLSVAFNVVLNEITFSLTCNIPELHVTDDMTVNFSQTLSITFKDGKTETPADVFEIDVEQIRQDVDDAVSELKAGTGRVIATIYTAFNKVGEVLAKALPAAVAAACAAILAYLPEILSGVRVVIMGA